MKVVIAPVAQRRINEVSDWWRENRLSASDVFRDELRDLIQRLKEMSPNSRLGVRAERTIKGLEAWRVRLTKTEQNVYYTVNEEKDELVIRTVWGARRRPLKG